MQILSRSKRPGRPAFTLIELLVVIAIISLLAAILFPVFSRVRENARRSSCVSNLRQIGLGMRQYMSDYDDVYPPHYNGTQRWPQFMNPYVKSYSVYNCPSRSQFNYDGTTNTAGQIGYGMNYWLNSYWYTGDLPVTNGTGIKEANVTHPSQTVWIAEIVGVPLGSDPATILEYQCYPSYWGAVSNRNSTTYGFDTIPDAKGRLSTRHFDGTVVVWADGHSKWMKRETLEADTGNFAASKYWWR